MFLQNFQKPGKNEAVKKNNYENAKKIRLFSEVIIFNNNVHPRISENESKIENQNLDFYPKHKTDNNENPKTTP